MKLIIIYVVLAVIAPFYLQAQQKDESNNLVVLVNYKARPDKVNEAINALTTLLKSVEKEPHYLSIRMHIDASDSTKILLYEEWASETYFKGDHMKTSHLSEFINTSRNFLAGPPDISFWKRNLIK